MKRRNGSINVSALIGGYIFFTILVGMPIWFIAPIVYRFIPSIPQEYIMWSPPFISFVWISYILLEDNIKKCEHGIMGGSKNNKCPDCVNEVRLRDKVTLLEYQIKDFDRNIANYKSDIERLEKKISFRHLENLHNMNPYEFEAVVMDLFDKMGFSVQQTSKSNDGGVDGVAYRAGKKYVIECKRYKSENKISRPTLQRFIAAIDDYNAYLGYFVTTSDFSLVSYKYSETKKKLTFN